MYHPVLHCFCAKVTQVSSYLILRWNDLFDQVYSDYLNYLLNLVLSQIPKYLYGSRRPSEAYDTNSAPGNFHCSCGLALVSAPVQQNGVVHSFCIILMILWIVCATEIKNTRVNRKIFTFMCGIFRLIHIFISPVRKLKTQKTDGSPSIKQLQQGMFFCSAMTIPHICWVTCRASASVADHPRYHLYGLLTVLHTTSASFCLYI